MLAQYALPAFAVLSVAAAQSAICTQSTATVNSAADATALASCSTIKGSVLLNSGASGVINLDGPQQITGDLVINGSTGLTTFGSSTLGSIGGTFAMNGLTLLSTLSMGALTSVGGIAWDTLDNLPSLTFPAVVSKAKSVVITNTFLSSLDGINLMTVDTLTVANNKFLKTFSTQVGNITSQLIISSNSDSLDVSFPNLIWAKNMQLGAIKSISIPSLAVVNGSLEFTKTFVSNIMAPNLTAVGNTATGVGSLSLNGNTMLTNLSMPLLTSVGGADLIANNTILSDIEFPKLQTVGGAIDFSGNFSTPNLPALVNVKGGFNLQSLQSVDCTNFKAESGSGKAIQGVFKCSGSLSSVGGISTNPSSTSSSKSAGKTNGPTSFGVNAAAIGLGAIGGLLQVL